MEWLPMTLQFLPINLPVLQPLYLTLHLAYSLTRERQAKVALSAYSALLLRPIHQRGNFHRGSFSHLNVHVLSRLVELQPLILAIFIHGL
jgi:hypothetical protein